MRDDERPEDERLRAIKDEVIRRLGGSGVLGPLTLTLPPCPHCNK